MSIAAAYLVSEGIVLGGDSSTTVQIQGGGVAQLLTHSQKVFEVGSNSRLGICTWGAGSFSTVSHRTIVAQLADKIGDATTVEFAVNELIKIVEPKFSDSGVEFVGYYLGGCDPTTHAPSCYRVEFQKEKAPKIAPLQLGSAEFSGTSNFFTRVFFGFDPQLPKSLKDELKKSLGTLGTIDNFDAMFDAAFENAYTPLTLRGFQDLPIREAIDFIYSYMHITIKAEKFKFGAPSCGGPIELGFITTDRCFRWVRHKPFHSAIIEQEGEYDVK